MKKQEARRVRWACRTAQARYGFPLPKDMWTLKCRRRGGSRRHPHSEKPRNTYLKVAVACSRRDCMGRSATRRSRRSDATTAAGASGKSGVGNTTSISVPSRLESPPPAVGDTDITVLTVSGPTLGTRREASAMSTRQAQKALTRTFLTQVTKHCLSVLLVYDLPHLPHRHNGYSR